MNPPSPSEKNTSSQRQDPSELALPGGFGRAVKVLGVALVLMVIGLVFGRKAWNSSSRKEAQQQVNDARRAIEQKDWKDAAALIRGAREVSPDDPELLRVMVDYLDKTGLDPVLQIQTLRALEASGRQQSGDVILMGRAHVRRGDLATARAVWQKLSKEQQTTAEALEFKAQILAQEGGEQEAGKLQQLATQKSAETPESALKLALHDLESGYPSMVASARDRLWQIADRDDNAGLQAIQHLLHQPVLILSEATHLQQRIHKHPKAALPDDLAVLSVIMRLDPARRSQLLDEVIKRHQDTSLETTVIVARWLAQEKEHERLVQLVPQEVMIKSKELFAIGLQELAESGRWQQMNELLKKKQALPMAVEGLSVWQALATSRLQPDLKQAAEELKLAIRQAGSSHSFGPLRAASQLAEDLELWEIALQGYLQLAQPESRQELDMLEKCWQMASRLGDSTQLLDIARKQSVLRPTSRHFANRLDYLRLLRGEEIESAITQHREDSVQDSEDSTTGALLAALKAYRLGDAALAKATLAHVLDLASLSPGQRAVYAGLLASSGDLPQAYQLAEKISSRLLIAEEQVFLQRAL